MNPLERAKAQWLRWDTPRERWLLAADDSDERPRSLMLEVAARVLFPTVLMLSVYLLFAGHNDAGGGFSGGLVAGLAFVLRYVAGGSGELAAAVRIRPPVVIGAGLGVAVVTAFAPVALGLPVLSTAVWSIPVPLLGDQKLATSVFLDFGVYLLIVGVVLDLLRTLGTGIEAGDLARADEEDAG